MYGWYFLIDLLCNIHLLDRIYNQQQTKNNQQTYVIMGCIYLFTYLFIYPFIYLVIIII